MSSTVEVARSPLPADAGERYAGKWIAVRDGEVVADADDFDALRADARVQSGDAIYHVPSPGSYFY